MIRTRRLLPLFSGILLFLSGILSLQAQNLIDEQGRKTGPWKVEYPNGRILYEAMFHEGRPVGEMIRYYENGAVRARMMFDSIQDQSYTRLFYKNGKPAAEGWHIRREKDSLWIYYSEFDGTVRIHEPYQGGKIHGVVQSFYPNGMVSEELTWEQNLKAGLWRQFYNTGSLRLSGLYKNDLLDGSYKVYYANNSLKIKGEYLNNKSHGVWSYYDDSGKEVYSLEFLNGTPVDQEKYDLWIQDSLKKYEVISEPESFQNL